eukprot:COSAG05_NODE_6687_length_920_cov_1.157125_1_plen_227_part_10
MPPVAVKRLRVVLGQISSSGDFACSSSSSSSRRWDSYVSDGLARGRCLGNRGALRLDGAGFLERDIVDSYHSTGFYVFEGVVAPAEVAEVLADFDELLTNAPSREGSTTDSTGKPSRFAEYYGFYTPPVVGESARVGMLSHPLMMLDSAVRLAGHPGILTIAAGINGADFVPMNESIFEKPAVVGEATVWHQDGRVHWTADGRALAALAPSRSGGTEQQQRPKTHGI